MILIHHMDAQAIAKLEQVFAYLTAEGWVRPAWIELLWMNENSTTGTSRRN